MLSCSGVTSISADLHKYGFAAKGASTITWRKASDRKYQFYAYGNWPGGLFVSPSLLGTRGGGPIAAAWAAMVANGEDGYMKRVDLVMETSKVCPLFSPLSSLLFFFSGPSIIIIFASLLIIVSSLHTITRMDRNSKLGSRRSPDCEWSGNRT